MPKMVCMKDGFELRPEKNGIFVIEMAKFGPYQIYQADLWKCENCEHEIIAGIAALPFSEHFHDNFLSQLTYAKSVRHCFNYGRCGEYRP